MEKLKNDKKEKKVKKLYIPENVKNTFHQLFWYFFIFSILGLVLETLYCYATMGIWESRKGLLYGPFCPVYGLGATLLILLLNRFHNHKIKLFVYGAVIGNALEYIFSFLLEAVYGTRFWDYSYLNFNLNGRICILYSIFWGILSLLLIQFAKPFIDKWINKIPSCLKMPYDITLTIFLIIDAILTVWGVSVYKQKAISIYYEREPESSNNSFISTIQDNLFSDSYMLKTFPNLRFVDKDGKEIYIRTIIE